MTILKFPTIKKETCETKELVELFKSNGFSEETSVMAAAIILQLLRIDRKIDLITKKGIKTNAKSKTIV